MSKRIIGDIINTAIGNFVTNAESKSRLPPNTPINLSTSPGVAITPQTPYGGIPKPKKKSKVCVAI